VSKEYIPRPVPNTQKIGEVLTYLQQELAVISDVINNNQQVNFDVANVEPSKRIEGMIRFFDGTNFNPGAGRGLYIFTNSTWQKL